MGMGHPLHHPLATSLDIKAQFAQERTSMFFLEFPLVLSKRERFMRKSRVQLKWLGKLLFSGPRTNS